MYDPKEENDAKGKLRQRAVKSSENGKTKSQINAEYFQALEEWLNDVRYYRYSCGVFAGFPCTTMAGQMGAFLPSQAQSSNIFASPLPTLNQGLGMFMFPNQQQQPNQPEGGTLQLELRVEYTIPPLWKRFIAESVDFVLLFFMKFTILFIAVDFFDLINIQKYESLENFDLKAVVAVTSELTFVEVAYRIIVCLYEAIFLRKGIQNQVGGATPGKTFMGLRVILCTSVEQVQNHPNIVKVIPATDLGFGWSLARALLKNLIFVASLKSTSNWVTEMRKDLIKHEDIIDRTTFRNKVNTLESDPELGKPKLYRPAWSEDRKKKFSERMKLYWQNNKNSQKK